MLLISTAGDLLPGQPQQKQVAHLRTRRARRVPHAHQTPQPRVSTPSTARTSTSSTTTTSSARARSPWRTSGRRSQWPHRHFAESLGLWEVNVYKALVHFHPQYKDLKHPRFRRLLAHALLTGGAAARASTWMTSRRRHRRRTRTRAEGHLSGTASPHQLGARREGEKKKTDEAAPMRLLPQSAEGVWVSAQLCFPPGPQTRDPRHLRPEHRPQLHAAALQWRARHAIRCRSARGRVGRELGAVARPDGSMRERGWIHPGPGDGSIPSAGVNELPCTWPRGVN